MSLAATVSPSTAFPVAPVIRSTLLQRFLAGTRTVSPVARHVLVTVLPLPPRRSDVSLQSACENIMLPSPRWRGLGLRSNFCRGHLWVHFRCGPVTRSPSLGRLCRLASSALFPSRMQPKLRGSDFSPGGTYLPLNMPAFAGRTPSRKYRFLTESTTSEKGRNDVTSTLRMLRQRPPERGCV